MTLREIPGVVASLVVVLGMLRLLLVGWRSLVGYVFVLVFWFVWVAGVGRGIVSLVGRVLLMGRMTEVVICISF